MEKTWMIIGFVGQAFFSARFIVQWLVSEWQKKSTIPTVFWFLSLFGGTILCAYAIYRRDPVFIVGQSTGILVYTRNLMLIRSRRKASKEEDGMGLGRSV